MSISTNLRVRPMRRSDLSAVTDVGANAFAPDELMEYMAPLRWQHYEQYRAWCGERQRSRFNDVGTWGYVCVDEEDAVLGYAWWERFGPKSHPSYSAGRDPWLQNNTSLFNAVERRLLALEGRYNTAVGRYAPAMDPARANDLSGIDEQGRSFINKVTPGWYLAVLAVSDKAQRRGVGGLLVQHGLDVARREATETGVAVPCTVTASPMGYGLYHKKGFRVVSWLTKTTSPELIERGLRMTGGQILVWDPERTWVKDLPPGSVNAAGQALEVEWSNRAKQTLP